MLSKYKKYLILLFIIVILLPIGIDKLIIGNNFYSNVSNESWVSFLGSYCGAIVSSIAAILGIGMTIQYSNEQAKKDREFSLKQESENRRLQIAPYLKYEQKNTLQKKHDGDILFFEEEYNTYVNTSIIIKNVGLGNLVNFNITSLKFNGEDLGYTMSSNSVMEKNEEMSILIDFRLKLDKIKKEDLIVNPEGDISKYSVPRKYNKGGNLDLLIEYSDLLENKYQQKVTIRLVIGFEADKDELEWKYSKPFLHLSKIEKPLVVEKSLYKDM